MARRLDSLEPVHLALELMRRIPRKRKVSAAELHQQLIDAGFERNLRTIQRQLQMLTRHFDIECDDSDKPYGYRWKDRARPLAVPGLSEQESLLLTLAEQHLHTLLPTSLMKSMDAFFTQARSNLGPTRNAKREREWLSKVRVVSTSQPLLPPTIRPGVFEVVSNALYANQWLSVDYENASRVRAKVDVMPLGLAQQGARLYLVCRYRGYDNERSLALHRIRSARASTITFERPRGFDLQRYDDDGRFGFGEGKRIKITFLIQKNTGHFLTESPLAGDQLVQDMGEYLEVSATVVETLILDQWLRGFGNSIRDIRRESVSSNY